VNDVASLFANELIPSEVFGSYDIFNEPDTVFPFLGPDITYDFIRATHDLIRAAHWSGSRIPNPELTVGLGGIDGTGASSTYDALARKGVAQTYVSGHIYPANVLELTQALRAGKAHARARNTHLVISEISAIAHSPGWLPSYLDVLSRENVATQIWGLIRSNFFLGGTPWKVWDGLVRSVPPKAFGVPVSFAVVDSEGVKAVEKWTGNN